MSRIFACVINRETENFETLVIGEFPHTVSSDITESEAGTAGTLFPLMALIRIVIGPVDYHGDLTADETLCDLVLSGGIYVWGTVRPPPPAQFGCVAA